MEFSYEGGVRKQYLLHNWSKSKGQYTHRNPVMFEYDLNEKRENSYIPVFYHERENPIDNFFHLMGEPYWPGFRLSSMTFGTSNDQNIFVFTYKLSAEILPAQHIEMEAQVAKVYKSGNALAIEGLDMTGIEVYDMAGKQIYKLGVEPISSTSHSLALQVVFIWLR